MGCAMHSRQSHRPAPNLHLLAQVVEAVGVASAQEVFAQVANAALNLAFGLRAVGPTQARGETPVAGEISKRRIEFHFAPVVYSLGQGSENDRFGVVVENLLRNPAQRRKRRLVHPQKGGQFLVGGDVAEHRPAVAQRQDEAVEFLARCVCVGDLAQVAPIHLRLASGQGLEAANGDRLRFAPFGAQIIFDGGIAARVALLFKFAQQNHRIPHARCETFFHKGKVGSQPRGAGQAGLVAGRLGLRQIFAYGRSAVAAQGADLADGQPLAFEFVDVVHFSTS